MGLAVVNARQGGMARAKQCTEDEVEREGKRGGGRRTHMERWGSGGGERVRVGGSGERVSVAGTAVVAGYRRVVVGMMGERQSLMHGGKQGRRTTTCRRQELAASQAIWRSGTESRLPATLRPCHYSYSYSYCEFLLLLCNFFCRPL